MVCARADCTVAETGACLLNNDLASCPELTAAVEEAGATTRGKAYFPPSTACTLDKARSLMARRYVYVVGILGEPAAGKTACLVSLYLLAGRHRLRGFRFLDSETLRGFEEISRGARRWNPAQPPEELTQHTKLTGDRSASFLHLRLGRRGESAGTLDFLMSDLPGEWTTELASKCRTERLAFLSRADVIWLVVDGGRLRENETRLVTRHRMGLVVARLQTLFAGHAPPIGFVVTRRDQGALKQDDAAALRSIAERRGFETIVVEVACFSGDDGEVDAGHGIGDLLEWTTQRRSVRPARRGSDLAGEEVVIAEIGLTRGGRRDA